MNTLTSNENLVAELEAAAGVWLLNKNKYTLESLRDARRAVLKQMQPHGTETPACAETYDATDIRYFLGWLSVELPELHKIETPVLGDAWDEWRKAWADPTSQKAIEQLCNQCGTTSNVHATWCGTMPISLARFDGRPSER